MVVYIKSDLDFILKQIKISEDHALYVQTNGAQGAPLFGPSTSGNPASIPAYNIAWGLRTVDGRDNHLLPGQETWGAADQEFLELLAPEFRTVMVDPDGPGPSGPIPIPYTPGNDVDGPGTFATPGDVIDPEVRTISNLLVDQTLANPAAILTGLQRAGIDDPGMLITASISAAYAPLADEFRAVSEAQRVEAAAAAAAAANPGNAALQTAAANAAVALASAQGVLDAAAGVPGGLYELLAANGIELDGANVHLPNIAPDEGLSAPFNSWFTLFGQFFDHGLDLVGKGGSGAVMIPLQPDDPLYSTAPGALNFMVLTRATTAGPDGIQADDPNTVIDESADNTRPINTTTSFVDQNQTYTSHASHQVFVRDYALGIDGRPHATGNLIEGANGGMATWAEVKTQALMLGIELEDRDVGNVPLLRTDQYGNFIPSVDGYAQVIVGIGVDGIPNTTDDDVVSGTPGAPVVPTDVFAIRTGHAFLADIAHGATPDGLADGDTEIGGNIPVDGIYDNELLDAHFIAGDGRVNENIGLTAVHHVFHAEHNRLVEHTKAVVLATGDAAYIAEWQLPDGSWNGERLFQAAKFGTEMQYQHLVFEEFARKVQPTINPFLVPDGFDTTMNPSIVAEFAHVVYRFGHSMLTESIDQFDPNFAPNHISLIQGFLNPTAFNGPGGTIDDEIAAGAIIRGMTRQAGNQIDEFVTSALRNNLLGLPLDLATINLARGRDTGVPSLNTARADFYEASNQNVLLKPYTSWVDFASHLKHEASIINFIAAYGTHALITGQTTIDGKRDAALTIITGTSVNGFIVPADRLDFLNSTGLHAGGSLGGLNNVDLWIGGLAEETMPFGGMLGSTFNFVFEVQMEMLQSGDRFYYLQRLDGLHLFGEMENNSFAAMIMRNTDATHLPSDVFSTPGLILEIDTARQFNDLNGDGVLESTDPLGGGLLTQLVIRDDPTTVGPDSYLRYTGGDHVVLGGTEADNTLIGGIGDDTLFGDGGQDYLDGGFGNDIINGGEGDDIIVDAGGDDNIKAGLGNDVVHAGPGLDLVMGNAGQDFIFLGTDAGSEVFAGEGNDFIYGNKNAERILGNEGNDWIETGTFDGAPGDNFDEVFALDQIDGHDVFLGDGGFDEFIGEGGDDIMVGSAGRGKMAGMSGFDWATYKDSALGTAGVNADLSIPIIFDEAPRIPANAALDEYQSMEGLSGSAGDDILRGSNILGDERLPFDPITNPTPPEGYQGSALDADGIALIDGLQDVVGAGVTSFINGDIILGGAGSDLMAGQAGDDILDGDKWLNVRISVRENANGTGAEIDSADSMTALATEMFNGTYNPGQLQIVREIVDESGAGFTDIAVFSDVRANYLVTNNPNGTVTVAHVTVSDGLESDGTDTLHNMERLRFSDIEIALNAPATGAPTLSDTTPTEGQSITASTAGIADANGLGSFSYQWQSSTDGVAWTNIAGATNPSFTPDDNAGTIAGDQAGLLLRTRVQFTDGGGTLETLFSAATIPVGQNWDALATGGATFNGNNGDDIAAGSLLNDTLNGAGGNDNLNGRTGSDTITGGAGNDTIEGGGVFGTDVSAYAGAAPNFSVEGGTVGAIQVIDGTGVEGTDTVSGVETLRFAGVNYTVVNGSNGTNTNLNGAAGAANSQAVFGFGGTDTINGGAGNDILHGGDGTDTITQTGSTGGRDSVNGGVGVDTYQLLGVAGAETFHIYTRNAAIAAGITVANVNTEIVVTRNGANDASIIAELDNIEEIRINTTQVSTTPVPGVANGDTVVIFGDFTETSLNFNTITIDGNVGDDTIDITSLDSAHRIVFRSNGGNDTIVGTMRPQDVIELPDGETADDYVQTVANGVTTLTNGDRSISYVATGEGPQIGNGNDDDDDDDNDNDNDNDDDDDDTSSGHGDNDDDDDDDDDDDSASCGGNDDDDETTSPTSGALRTGTPQSDVLNGTAGADNIIAFAGDDVAIGNDGDDAISAGEGADFVNGGGGRDVIFAGAGDDQVFGGAQADIIYGEAGADRIFGEQGNDLVNAGAGDDTVFGGAGDDLIVAEQGDGNDAYFGDNGDGGTGNDTLDMSAVTVDVTAHLGAGPLANGSATSTQTGSDTLWGIENINTGSGNDTITASNATNVMNGGAGDDTFKFLTSTGADGDTIVGFQPGDHLDLSAIDANTAEAGDQSFSIVSGGAFTAAGQLAVTFGSRTDGALTAVFTVVEGNIDGDEAADFKFEVEGHHNLNSSFNL